MESFISFFISQIDIASLTDLVDLVNGFLSQKWYSVVLDIKTREAIEYEWEKD